MRTTEIIYDLDRFDRRGAGTNSERRAALWLAEELASPGREARVEPFWCRPNWALAHAWHVALGIAGSLLSVHFPRVGGVLLLLAALFVILDAQRGTSPGRRLSFERASQNVVASTPDTDKRVRLIIVANYDAGRTGLVYRRRLRGAAAALHRLTRGLAPGWLGWLLIALAWLVAVAIARQGGSKGTVIGIEQLIPTVGLVLALALLLDLAGSEYAPAAADNGSGVAVALALARALDAAPPARAAIEVVLGGACDVAGIGMRTYLRARRGQLKPSNTVVLGIAPCAAGEPRWWVSDGSLIPMRYYAGLRALCADVAREDPGLGAKPHRGRGFSPSFPARIAGLPTIAIGCLDERGLVPHSHQPSDLPEAVDPASLDRAVQLGLMLVDAIDGFLARMPRPNASARA